MIATGVQSDPWHFSLSQKQSDAWWALADDVVKELMYGGAKFGGKSFFGVHWMWNECYEIARKYVPKPLKHPIPVGFMGRKIGKHFKETTLDTWKRFIPPDRYKIKGDPAEITIADRVLIRTGGLEAKEDLEKFNSAEFARIFVRHFGSSGVSSVDYWWRSHSEQGFMDGESRPMLAQGGVHRQSRSREGFYQCSAD
jgi:hypothetical protein